MRHWTCCAPLRYTISEFFSSLLDIEAVITPGKTGQFDVIADGERIAERGGNWFTRRFGAGYPDLDSLVEQLDENRRASGAA
jgi:hypothetical protein